MKKLIVAVMVTILIMGCHRGVVKEIPEESRLESRGADIDGLDDPLEPTVKIKVGDISIWKWGFYGTGDQNFYRGYIDKTTLAASYQLYMQIRDFSWRYWDNARYMSPDGLKASSLIAAGKNVECGHGVCIHSEDLIMNVDRPTLESWKTSDAKIRVTSSSVEGNVDADVDNSKTKDFLNAMDKVTAYLRNKKK